MFVLRNIILSGFFTFSFVFWFLKLKPTQMYTPQKGNLEVSFNDTLLSFMLCEYVNPRDSQRTWGGGGWINSSVVELDVALVYDTLTPKCNRQIRKENKFCTKRNQESRIGKMKKLNLLVVNDSIACIILNFLKL